MSDPKVLVYTPMGDVDAKYSELEDAGCDVTFGNAEWRRAFGADESNVFPLADGRDAIIGAVMRGFMFDHAFMSRLPNTRIIAKLTIGYDDVDIDAAADLGILVTHSPTEANWGGVAEGTMTMMLTMLKRIREKDRHVRDGGWRDDSLAGTYLGARQDGYEGITVGIIGLGRIGSRLCDLLAPWRVNLIAHDPYVDESKFAHHNARAVDMETLLRTSDVVTIHSNLTAETEHLISEAQFGHDEADGHSAERREGTDRRRRRSVLCARSRQDRRRRARRVRERAARPAIAAAPGSATRYWCRRIW